MGVTVFTTIAGENVTRAEIMLRGNVNHVVAQHFYPQ